MRPLERSPNGNMSAIKKKRTIITLTNTIEVEKPHNVSKNMSCEPILANLPVLQFPYILELLKDKNFNIHRQDSLSKQCLSET